MGPVTYPNQRLGFQYCIDAMPSNAEGSHSVKPGGVSNFSLPPTERFKKENMLLMIVIPTSIKDPSVKKYYDFMATYELNDLFVTGVSGVKVKIFSTSMDTPGRAELMGNKMISYACFVLSSRTNGNSHTTTGMSSCMSYQGCPVCLHSWTAGSTVGQRKCIYDGYRRFLPLNSRARRRTFRHGGNIYEYGSRETRDLPRYRDNEFVQDALRMVGITGAPFLGHKFPPHPARWPGFTWWRYNVGEMMHDSKVFTEMVVKTLVGKGPAESGYQTYNKDAAHRRQAKTLGIMEDTWPENGGPLPFRLTKPQRDLLHKRMASVVWPHYMERLFYKGHSCWTKKNRMWKARRKFRLMFFMLVTQLRDQVAAVRHALNLFVWVLRRLMGQVHSFMEAKRLNILPGSRTLRPSDFDAIKRDLILALVLLNGCLPITQLNPALHHFEHYVEYAITHGLLILYWMMGFERNNKHMKGLIKNPHHPEMSLAKASTRDVSARFINLQSDTMDIHRLHPHPRRPHDCVLWGKPQSYFPTEREIADLRFLGADVDILNVTQFPIAYILNVHFKAGEWGQRPRCGSVITCVVDGRSLYARVNTFLIVEGDDHPGYASVSWFSPPEYPLQTPIVVKVTDDGDDLDFECGCIVSITQIDPSPIMVECDSDNDCYFMMRDSGYDTQPTEE